MNSTGAGGFELYLYYRAPVTRAAAVQAAFECLRQALRGQVPGLDSRLLRRPEVLDAEHTWMEIHALDGGIDAELEARIEAAAAAAFAGVPIGTRHRRAFHRMCLVALALGASERFPLVLASNRDEFFERPALPLAWWSPQPGAEPLLAGRDLLGGGTWLGLNARGRLALVTNIRRPGTQRVDAESRGAIVPRWLATDADVDAFWARLQPDRFNGFNLICGELGRNEFSWMASDLARSRPLAPGIHGLSNAALDAPWPKVEALEARLAQALTGAGDLEHLRAELFEALSDPREAADAELPTTGVPLDVERWLSAAFIRSPDGRYGTRCSTLLIAERIAGGGLRVELVERSHAHPGQVADERREQLVVQAGDERRP